MSAQKRATKTSYRASPRSIRPLYTGGPVLLTRDGRWLITTMDEEVIITDTESGASVGRVRGDGSAITSLALSYHTSPATLVTCHMSTTVRFYQLPDPIDTSASSSTSTPLLSYTRQLNKAHSAPILVSTVSSDSTLLATGSSDGVVKVWDTAGGYVTHLYRGHGGPVSAVKFWFNEDKTRMELWTGSTDGKVRVFDLLDASTRSKSGDGSAKAKMVLQGHESVVRGIDITSDGKWAVSGGRDKIVLVWDLETGLAKKSTKGKGKDTGGPRIVQTILAQEQVETLGLLPVDQGVQGGSKNRLMCYTGGDQGLVRVWDVLKGEEVVRMKAVEGVDEVSEGEDEQRGIINVLYDEPSSSLVSIHADQNIIFHSLTSSFRRQIIGFNDEIIDATFLSDTAESSHSRLALATNSSLVRLYSTDRLDARILSGHSDMVLCLDKTTDHNWLASGSKDMTARIWAPIASEDEEPTWRCIGICQGHAESVGAVAFSRQQTGDRSAKFIVTASQDRTLKLWDLSTLDPEQDGPEKLKSLMTLRAHEKDINSLDVSPNDKYLVSGSQDKLVKIFEIDYSASGPNGGLRLVGTCKGHRRGVWTVKFSKTDKVIASGAADRTVKLWSLDDFTCLKTFEGHTNSVLRVDFLSSGMQLVTSSSDGLVKLWNIKDESCVKTLDNHEDKVWALAVSSDERTIVSAGADSVATFWEDSTEVEQAERNDAIVQAVQSEQDFTNYLALKDYRRAIQLALAMSQPGRLLSLFTSVLSASHIDSENGTDHSTKSYSGSVEIDQVIRTLSGLDLTRLLKHVRDWNANARTSSVAQGVLNAVLKLKTPEEILAAFDSTTVNLEPSELEDGEAGGKRKKARTEVGLRDLLDGLLPYSERHFGRLGRLIQDSYVLDYVVGEMDGGMFGGEVMDVAERR